MRLNTRYMRKPIKASWEHGIELTGKMLGAYVLIHSSLNWLYYRRINKSIEESQKDKKK